MDIELDTYYKLKKKGHVLNLDLSVDEQTKEP